MDTITDNVKRAERAADEVVELAEKLEPSYGIDALGIAAGYVAGKHRLDPDEYVPKLIELVNKRSGQA